MGKLIKDWKANKLDPWNDVLARWLLLLGIVDRRNDKVYQDIYKELEDIAMKDKTLHSAFNNWEEISMIPEQRIAYESRLKYVMDEEAAIRERALRDEEAKKREEEIEKREEKLGKEIGRREAKESIAHQLLIKGLDIETIVEVTGLEKERIKEIGKEE